MSGEFVPLIDFAVRLAVVAVVVFVLISALLGITVMPWVIVWMLRGVMRRLDNIEVEMFAGFDYDPDPLPVDEGGSGELNNNEGVVDIRSRTRCV